MPRNRKPTGWPRYMVGKRQKGGRAAYYWAPPTWAKRAGCTIESKKLGTEYAIAIQECELLNQHLDAWRTGRDAPKGPDLRSLNGVCARYRGMPTYVALLSKPEYEAAMTLVCGYRLRDGRRLGDLPAEKITLLIAQLVYDKIVVGPNGQLRPKSINRTIRIMGRAWGVVAKRDSALSKIPNPFRGLELLPETDPQGAEPATWEHLQAFIAAADALGLPNVGTAALIAFELFLRTSDIRETLQWGQWLPDQAPNAVIVRHRKTKVQAPIPIRAKGTLLFPELEQRIDATPKRGLLIIMDDKVNRTTKAWQPYSRDTFSDRVPRIVKHAGLPAWITFGSFRKGGINNARDAADLNDNEIMSITLHKTRQVLSHYVRDSETMRERINTQRMLHRASEHPKPAKTGTDDGHLSE